MDFQSKGKQGYQGTITHDESELDGSDFSNKDISRSDDIIDQYIHTLLNTSEKDGYTVYEIEPVPHEDVAVVWGVKLWRSGMIMWF